MQRFLVALFALFAFLASVLPAHGAAAKLTNAERLRRNLPPLPPVKRAPTPAYAAKRQHASAALPVQQPSGRIQLRSSDGSTLGYVAASNGSGVNFLPSGGDLEVELQGSNLLATNAAFSSPFYIGGSGSNPISADSANSVSFTHVAQGAGSSIWTYASDTGGLTAQWTNQDGSKPTTVVAYDIRNNIIVLTGNVDLYNSQATFPASAVTLFLVS